MNPHNSHYNMNTMGASEEQQLLAKWKPLLEAHDEEAGLPKITNKHTALVTARMLENQVKHMSQNPDTFGHIKQHQALVSEAVGTAGLFNGYGNSDPAFNSTDTTDSMQPVVGQYGNQVPPNDDFYARGDSRLPNIVMPMIRRTFPELLANEIVGIQPMNGPVGLAFALRFKYDGENLADFTPDGGSTVNPPATATHPFRGFGQEAGYQYLNTAHTGLTSDGLGGLDSNTGLSAQFEYIPEDQGVANLIKNLECSTQIPQMSMCIEKTAVEAGVRKLAFKYSLEAEQDLMNMHSINLEDEMTNYMQYEMQAEIDREILMRMIQVALNNGEGAGYSVWSPANADGRWQAEKAVTLLQKIRIEAQRLCTRNRMGAANFAVVTPNVAAVLENTQFFKSYESTSNVARGCGSARIGTIGNIKVFVDSRTEAQFQAGLRDEQLDYILLGFKGNSASETGLVYLPYVPIYVQKTTGVNDFSPRVGMATRYALMTNLFGAENFYHVIIMKGLFDYSDGTESKVFI